MSDSKSTTNWDYTVYILVVGSGGGAMAAAVCAHDRGAKTLLIEKDEYYGGSTAMSGSFEVRCVESGERARVAALPGRGPVADEAGHGLDRGRLARVCHRAAGVALIRCRRNGHTWRAGLAVWRLQHAATRLSVQPEAIGGRSAECQQEKEAEEPDCPSPP